MLQSSISNWENGREELSEYEGMRGKKISKVKKEHDKYESMECEV